MALWIWPRVIQKELDRFRLMANTRRTRKQKNKILPSGHPPSFIYDNPGLWGAEECLIPVDYDVTARMLEEMEPTYVTLADWGVPDLFAERAEALLPYCPANTFDKITLSNAWTVFSWLVSRIEWRD